MSKLVNFVGFQAGWFACVLGATHGAEWVGPAYVLVWCGAHVRASGRASLALLVVALLGTLVACLELGLGWLTFAGEPLLAHFPPLWIVALWLLFATTFESSLAWITRRHGVTALFCLIGAPLSYLAGERLGAVAILEPRGSALLGIGVLWALAVPVAVELQRRIGAQK